MSTGATNRPRPPVADCADCGVTLTERRLDGSEDAMRSTASWSRASERATAAVPSSRASGSPSSALARRRLLPGEILVFERLPATSRRHAALPRREAALGRATT